MLPITHLTLNSGHAAPLLQTPWDMATIAALRPLVEQGGGPLPGLPDYRVTILSRSGTAVFTIFRGQGQEQPLTANVLCYDPDAEAEAYTSACDLARAVQASRPPFPPRPPLPWLATVVLPGLAGCRQAGEWLADAERCLAYAILSHSAGQN